MNSTVSSDAAFNSNSQAPSLAWPTKKCSVNCISLAHFSAGAKAFLMFNHMIIWPLPVCQPPASSHAEGLCSDLGCSTKKHKQQVVVSSGFRSNKEQRLPVKRTQCNNKLDTTSLSLWRTFLSASKVKLVFPIRPRCCQTMSAQCVPAFQFKND